MSDTITPAAPAPVPERKRVITPRTEAQREAQRQYDAARYPTLREQQIARIMTRYASDEAYRTRVIDAARMRSIVQQLAAGKGVRAESAKWYASRGGDMTVPIKIVVNGRPTTARPATAAAV